MRFESDRVTAATAQKVRRVHGAPVTGGGAPDVAAQSQLDMGRPLAASSQSGCDESVSLFFSFFPRTDAQV